MRPALRARGFGIVSSAEQRQADLFLADLLGHVRPRSRRAAWGEDTGAYGEDASVALQMRGGGIVGNAPSATNVREDVLHALDRLHVLWSITNANYGREYPSIAALPAGRRVSNPDVTLTQLVAAIRQNEGAHLHDRVIQNFFAFEASAPVGSGQPNRTADVRALQVILVAHGLLDPAAVAEGTIAGGAVRESTMPQTIAAIREVKKRIAGGRLGWDPIHADELESGGDRFGSRTYTSSNLSVFVPRGVASDRNDVHVFFSPGDVQGSSGLNAVLHHGMRGASEGSGWILVGVPGREPGHVTIDTAQIADALRRIGRSPTIDRLRLSAHSRGGRGLRETIKGPRPLVDLAKIDRVVLLDCAFRSVAAGLTAAAIPPAKVIAYQVVDAALPARVGRNIRIDPRCTRAIGYSRLIQDAMRTRPSLTIPSDIRRQLLTLPARGQFKAATATSGSADNLDDFCRSNASAIAAIVRNEGRPDGLMTFLDSNDLGRLGSAFGPSIYSHHFFVAEVAHEITS